jgi:hypothetical protein
VLFEKDLIYLNVPHTSSKVAYTINSKEIEQYDPATIALRAKINDSFGDVESDNHFFLVRSKDLKLQKPNVQIIFNEGSKTITLTTDFLAKDVYLYVDE